MARAVLNPLTKEEEDIVHSESLRILEEIGIKVTSPEVLMLLKDAGAAVDMKTQLVKMNEELVKGALAKAPKEFSMSARDRAKDVRLPAVTVQGVNDGQPTDVWDVHTQSRRKSRMDDLIDLTVVCDAMPEVDLYWPEVVATDLPAEVSNVHEYAASVAYTDKHVQHGAGSVEDAQALIDIASAIVGSEDELRKRPIVSITHTPITPLRYQAGDIDAAVMFARAGLPVIHLSMAISGSVCPVSLAGTILLVNAENLAGFFISQSAAAGAPVMYSSESGPMDMRSGVFLSGSTEGALINAAGCQMARRYRIPSQVGGTAASGTMPGFEVGYQKAMSGLLPALAGADQVVGIGGFDRSGCESVEQIVMDCELWRNVLRACRGVEVDKDTLAFDAIARVGPGGYFMKDIHTLKHFKSEILLPRIAMRPASPGAREEPIREAARAEVKRILAEHRPMPLDKSVVQAVKDLLARYDTRLHGKPVSTKYLDRVG
ncbi:MAG: trimethylamine methyltransferase family protein [Candidatus Thermoplasmatota archaeon]|nr:trimethylamine methyltransferase family protein [Candidatus Thermoplasmatota archaeon]